MKRWAAGFAALAAIAAVGLAQAQTTAPTTPEMPIYSNALAPGWSNWSWADVQLSIEIADPAERPISIRADGWEALYFQHAPFSTAGYSNLHFFAHGGARGGQVLQMQALNPAGEALPNTYQRVTLTANEWTEVSIPLSTMGAENQTVSGFWIQNGSGETVGRFLVNEVSLR
jgi:hypothetical protein